MEMLTTYQIQRKVTAAANQWLKGKGYLNTKINCIRGTFHLTNGVLYMLTAEYVLSQVCSYEFEVLNNSMAKLKNLTTV